MSDGLQMVVKGGPRLERNLRELATKDLKAVLRKAMRAGAKVILPAAKANTPLDSGQLKRSIRVRATKRSRTHVGITVVTGKEFFKGDFYYGGMQEFGWKTGRRGTGNRRPVPGKHFLQKAARARGKAAGDVVVSTAWRLLKARALLKGGLGGGVV